MLWLPPGPFICGFQLSFVKALYRCLSASFGERPLFVSPLLYTYTRGEWFWRILTAPHGDARVVICIV
jgi:hypothetical protein